MCSCLHAIHWVHIIDRGKDYLGHIIVQTCDLRIFLRRHSTYHSAVNTWMLTSPLHPLRAYRLAICGSTLADTQHIILKCLREYSRLHSIHCVRTIERERETLYITWSYILMICDCAVKDTLHIILNSIHGLTITLFLQTNLFNDVETVQYLIHGWTRRHLYRAMSEHILQNVATRKGTATMNGSGSFVT